MKRASIMLRAVATALTAFSVAGNARALGPVDLEIAGKVGGGTNPVSGGPGLNPLGFGIGARGGGSLYNVYAGLSFMYYFGGGQDLPGPLGGTVHDSASSVLYGIELGYNIPFLGITLRPQIGVGNYTMNVTGSATVLGVTFPGSSTWENVYLEPGVTAKASFGHWFVAADANLFWLPGASNVQVALSQQTQFTLSSQVAFTAHGQAGVQF
jgi:hypothetical protein